MSADDEAPRKSFKDRIAMFNQPKEAAAAPPPRAPKPKVFKWKTSSEDSGEPAGNASSKVATLAEPPPPAPTPTPSGPGSQSTAQDAEPLTATSNVPGPSGGSSEAITSEVSPSKPSTASQESSGLSASDAKSKAGSLKDRIAALSGLKVDQPGLPGRPPKPWKKKPEPAVDAESGAVGDTAEASEDAPGMEKSPAIEVDTEKAQTIAPGTDTPGEPLDDGRPPLSRAASSTTETKPAGDETAAASNKGAVAMPAMPTRARGPQRKARSGNTAPSANAATSPAAAKEVSLDEVAPTVEAATPSIHYSPDATKDSAPSLQDIASPATEPAEFVKSPRDEKDTPLDAEGAEALEASEPLEEANNTAATNTRGPLPKPPPTAATAAEDREEESEEDEEGKVEHDIEQAEEQLARQTLEDPAPSDKAGPAPSLPSSPVGLQRQPPLPPAIDTSTRPVPDAASIRSPTSPPLLNRRSMTRPPVPTGFSQTDSASASPKSSFDAVRPTGSSFDGGNRRSMSVQSFRSSSEAIERSATPDENAGDGEFANPALDSGPKSPLQPPISRPFDTQVESIASPTKQSSVERMRSQQPSAASSSGSVRTGPSRQGSMASVSSALGQSPASRAKELPEGSVGDQAATEQPQKVDDEDEDEEEYEDPEVARRQALAKRMAAMGGMKMGMLPPPMLAPKRKKTMPLEREGSEGAAETETVTSPLRETAPPLTSPIREQPSSPSPRPSPATRMSHLPPPGAFVLPGLGRPAPPQPVESPTQEAQEDEVEGVASPVEEGPGDATIVADNVKEDDVQLASPPPIPATARPSRPPPPPVEQVSDEEEEEEEEGNTPTSELQRSMSGAEGPSAEDSIHEDQPVQIQEAESLDSSATPADDMEAVPSAPPSRPSRPPPPLMTSNLGSADEERQVESPISSVRSYSQRSVPGTPISAHGRQASLPQMSPVPSNSPDRRSSMMLPVQGGSYPQTQNSQPMQSAAPGLSHGYLAQLATSAIRTKSREVDGPLANIINDIAYAQRADPNMFGTSVWRTWVTGEKGAAADLQIHGKIEAGCVFLAWDAKFDRGIGRSSLKIGSLQVPHIAIVAEDVKDVKKPKVRVIELLQGRHHEVTYKLDDLKLGSVDIRRLP